MRVVHGHATEPALPEVSGALFAGVDMVRVAAVRARQGPPKSVFIGRNQDLMNVVGHRRPAPDLDRRLRAVFGQEVQVELIVPVAEKGSRAAIAALEKSWKDRANEPGHAVKP